MFGLVQKFNVKHKYCWINFHCDLLLLLVGQWGDLKDPSPNTMGPGHLSTQYLASMNTLLLLVLLCSKHTLRVSWKSFHANQESFPLLTFFCLLGACQSPFKTASNLFYILLLVFLNKRNWFQKTISWWNIFCTIVWLPCFWDVKRNGLSKSNQPLALYWKLNKEML